MDKVVSISELKQRREDREPHFNVWAMCLPCSHRWIGTVHYKTSLFSLLCPECGSEESFASIIPNEYLLAHEADDESIINRERE